jgi:hypothetical protein
MSEFDSQVSHVSCFQHILILLSKKIQMNHIRPSLRADEIRKQMKLKQNTRGIIYDKVVDYIHRYISQKSSIGVSNMIYEIPFVVMGLPAINVSECFIHVARSLQSDGYCVRYVPPRSIYVSWDISEKGMYMTSNEILSASSNISCPFRPIKPEIRCSVSNSSCFQATNESVNMSNTELNKQVGEYVDPRTNFRDYAQIAPKQNQMFPWESFESRSSVCLLPPPQMTVTDIKTIEIRDQNRDTSYGTHKTRHVGKLMHRLPVEQEISVESIGPGGGLVLNL